MGFRFHYGLHVLLSDCSPPPLAGTQLSAHYQLNPNSEVKKRSFCQSVLWETGLDEKRPASRR